MTVGELIARLSTLPEHIQVVVRDADTDWLLAIRQEDLTAYAGPTTFPPRVEIAAQYGNEIEA